MSIQSRFNKMFEHGNIGTLELKNRIIMPPMGSRLCGQWGEVTDDLIAWYVTRARGGSGLIVVEENHTATALEPIRYGTRSLRADDDSYFPGLFKLAEAIHDTGAKAGINLTVGKALAAASGPWEPLGREFLEENILISPSGIPPLVGERKVRTLSSAELEKMVELIGHAARRVKQVGFDLIEINAHLGYLVAEFMSPYFNKRQDEYGGNLESRLRFLSKIIDSIRRNVGQEFPLVVKYAVDEKIEGGFGVDEGQKIAEFLENKSINAISVCIGTIGSMIDGIAPYYFSEGHMIHLAKALKQSVRIPIILSGRLGNPSLAEQVLEEGNADFIALGRPLIADPNWPRKVAEGRFSEIRMCLSCNDCLKVPFLHKGPVRCAINATAGRERDCLSMVPALKVKRVSIIGAGPAGLEASRIAAIRGHKVTLYDRTNELGGGQLKCASMPPHKEKIREYIINYYLEAFKNIKNLEVRLGKEVTLPDIMTEKPDAVIVATGGEPYIPNISGIDMPNVITIFDLLGDKAKTGKTVIVVGGGSIGCETANFLAQRGKKVTIVEMMESVGTDMDIRLWKALSAELLTYGVSIITSKKINNIVDEGAILTDKQGNEELLRADTVVLACGMKPVNALVKDLEGMIEEIYVIGDAKQPRSIRNAISDGYICAYKL